MSRSSGWTSRGILIGTLALAIMAFAVPYIIEELRYLGEPAEKAYYKGWQSVKVGALHIDYSKSVAYFRKAIRLKPDDLRYQLSLVEASHDNDKALTAVMEDNAFHPQARAMAAYRRAIAVTRSGAQHEKDVELKLSLLNKAAALDKDNAQACYMLAAELYKLGSGEEAAALVREGNQRLYVRHYSYIHPAFEDTSLEALMFSSDFSSYAQRRELARYQLIRANYLSRQRDAEAAISALEDGTAMSVKFAASEPRTFINYLVSIAVFKICSSTLESMYKDFGLSQELIRLKDVDRAFEVGLKDIRQELGSTRSFSRAKVSLLYLNSFGYGYGCAVGILLALAGLYWGLTRMLRARSSESRFELDVWEQGQVCRTLIIVNMLVLGLAAIAFFILQTWPRTTMTIMNFSVFAVATMVVGVLAVILNTGLTARGVRQKYESHLGQVGWTRFLFRLPMAHAEWRTRQVAVGLGVSLLFLIWYGLLIVALSKPALGVYPWQDHLIAFSSTNESEIVTRILQDGNMLPEDQTTSL